MVRAYRRKGPSESAVKSRARSLVSNRSLAKVTEGDEEFQLGNGPRFDPTDHVPEFREAGVSAVYVSPDPSVEHYADSLVFVVPRGKQARVLKKLLYENWGPDDFDDSKMGDYFLYRLWWD